uniref:Uncharacterized protein n=1 Tax=Timema shepardi TaxID=629360 RepID=A0A7R9B5Y4_TIMSH|nr:unnamed protein product [Timema shepardi]
MFSHALYLYDKERLNVTVPEANNDLNSITPGFESMTSTLTVEQDRQLQLFLVRRLRKGAIYTGTGNFSGMDFSLGDMSHSPAVCFYILLLCGTTSIGSPRQIVICLLSTGESNLEVFRPELTQFCEGLAANMSSLANARVVLSSTAEDGEIETPDRPFGGVNHLITFYIVISSNVLDTATHVLSMASNIQQSCVILTQKLADLYFHQPGRSIGRTILARQQDAIYVKDISSLSGELCRWHSVCIMYVCRVLEMLGANVAFLLQLAQQNGRLRTEDDKEPRLAEDIQRFLSACTVAECLGSQPSQPPVALLREGVVRGLEVNAYCRDWGLLLLEHSHSAEPWRIRRAMEAFKLKVFI